MRKCQNAVKFRCNLLHKLAFGAHPEVRMIYSPTAALRQVRDDIAAVLDPHALRDLCRQVGHSWRNRTLDPVTTIQSLSHMCHHAALW